MFLILKSVQRLFLKSVSTFPLRFLTLKLAITIDEDLYEELEEILVMSDIGMDTTIEIIDRLKERKQTEF